MIDFEEAWDLLRRSVFAPEILDKAQRWCQETLAHYIYTNVACTQQERADLDWHHAGEFLKSDGCTFLMLRVAYYIDKGVWSPFTKDFCRGQLEALVRPNLCGLPKPYNVIQGRRLVFPTFDIGEAPTIRFGRRAGMSSMAGNFSIDYYGLGLYSQEYAAPSINGDGFAPREAPGVQPIGHVIGYEERLGPGIINTRAIETLTDLIQVQLLSVPGEPIYDRAETFDD